MLDHNVIGIQDFLWQTTKLVSESEKKNSIRISSNENKDNVNL